MLVGPSDQMFLWVLQSHWAHDDTTWSPVTNILGKSLLSSRKHVLTNMKNDDLWLSAELLQMILVRTLMCDHVTIRSLRLPPRTYVLLHFLFDWPGQHLTKAEAELEPRGGGACDVILLLYSESELKPNVLRLNVAFESVPHKYSPWADSCLNLHNISSSGSFRSPTHFVICFPCSRVSGLSCCRFPLVEGRSAKPFK